MMTADQIRAAYARTLKETILVRRYTGLGASRPRFDVSARGKATQYGPAEDLVSTVQQGDQRVIILAADLIDRQFTLPVTNLDKLVVRGKELAIINPDERRAPDGTLIAYDIQARG